MRKVRGHTHGDALCTGKACTDAGSLVTVAVGVPACMVTPSAGSGSLPSHSHPRLPDDVAANSIVTWGHVEISTLLEFEPGGTWMAD